MLSELLALHLVSRASQYRMRLLNDGQLVLAEIAVAVLKRLVFTAHTMVLAHLKDAVTSPDGAVPKKISFAEMEDRMAALKKALPGLTIEKHLVPSHSLLEKAIFEKRILEYLPPERCYSREWELMHNKPQKSLELDVGKMVIKE